MLCDLFSAQNKVRKLTFYGTLQAKSAFETTISKKDQDEYD
jgi:hypothetical protein